MALKSFNTKEMTKIELKALQETVEEMSAEMLKKFRERWDLPEEWRGSDYGCEPPADTL